MSNEGLVGFIWNCRMAKKITLTIDLEFVRARAAVDPGYHTSNVGLPNSDTGHVFSAAPDQTGLRTKIQMSRDDSAAAGDELGQVVYGVQIRARGNTLPLFLGS